MITKQARRLSKVRPCAWSIYGRTKKTETKTENSIHLHLTLLGTTVNRQMVVVEEEDTRWQLAGSLLRCSKSPNSHSHPHVRLDTVTTRASLPDGITKGWLQSVTNARIRENHKSAENKPRAETLPS